MSCDAMSESKSTSPSSFGSSSLSVSKTKKSIYLQNPSSGDATKKSKRPRRSAIVQALSFVWFALCTSVVTKHNDLVAIFYSFAGSFIVAISISHFRKRDLMASTVGAFSGDLSTSQRRDNGTTKAYTGIIICVISLAMITSSRYSHLMMNSPEFHALANVAGFLAFDLWYDRVCCRLFPPRLLSILEDAFTLSAFSVILTKWEEWDIISTPTTAPISLWLGYKILRLTSEIAGHGNAVESSNITNVVAKEYLWTIHGKDYDLSKFIHRHPGGKEAILLGRGRDCSALFESYHPFTKRHR